MTELPIVVNMTVDASPTEYDLKAETNQQALSLSNDIVIDTSGQALPLYEGPYTVTPSTTTTTLLTDGKRCNDDITVAAVRAYTGSYNVTANTSSAQVLPTSGLLMSNDVTVRKLTAQSVPELLLSVSNNGLVSGEATIPPGTRTTPITITRSQQLSTKARATITPTTASQTAVARHKWTTGAVTVRAIPSPYADVSGVTATAGDVLSGKYFVDSSGVLTLGTGTGGSMDTETKDALLECFEHVAWIDTDGQIYYNNLLNALYPLQSISAVYTQSGTVTPSTPLDDLKSDLVVTATFEDGTTKTVTNYTLSGTLAVGTSTVTVTYFTETTTFNVTVSLPSDIVYQLSAPLVCDGSNSGSTSTEYTLLSTDHDYTITTYITRSTTIRNNSYVFQCMQGSSPYWGLKLQINNSKYLAMSYGVTNSTAFNDLSPSSSAILKIVVRHTQGTTSAKWQMAGSNNTIISRTIGSSSNTATSNMRLGGAYYTGTINSFTIYNRVLSDAEAETFLTTN